MHVETVEEQASRAEHRRLDESENSARAPWTDRQVPLLARMIGIRKGSYWKGWNDSHRTRYGEISFGSAMFALSLGCHEDAHLHVAIPGVQIFFHMPRWVTRRMERGDCSLDNPSYGFSWRFGRDWGGGDIHTNWGRRGKIVAMPWGWHKRPADYRREYLDCEGQWVDHRLQPQSWHSDDTRSEMGREPWSEVYPYHYMCQPGGEAQHVNATVTRERCFRVYRVFGIPTRRKLQHSISVAFDQEVGNQRGSWKGGCVGCGADMKPGDTPGMTLRRMQVERRFDR